MALTNKNYLDLHGLQTYDALLKALIPTADEETITRDSTTGEFSLKNPPTVVGEVLQL